MKYILVASKFLFYPNCEFCSSFRFEWTSLSARFKGLSFVCLFHELHRFDANFVADFCVEQKLTQKSCPWRKNDNYHACSGVGVNSSCTCNDWMLIMLMVILMPHFFASFKFISFIGITQFSYLGPRSGVRSHRAQATAVTDGVNVSVENASALTSENIKTFLLAED